MHKNKSEGTKRRAPALRVTSGLKGGRVAFNHNRTPALRVTSGVKGGKLASNHNRRAF